MFSCSFVTSFLRLFVRSFARLFVPSFFPPIVRSFRHSTVPPFVHSVVRSFARAFDRSLAGPRNGPQWRQSLRVGLVRSFAVLCCVLSPRTWHFTQGGAWAFPRGFGTGRNGGNRCVGHHLASRSYSDAAGDGRSCGWRVRSCGNGLSTAGDRHGPRPRCDGVPCQIPHQR